MFKGKKILVVIPARSQSKGIKNKNIRNVKGKKMFLHSIDYAKKSNIVDKIILSTDSLKYLKIAEKYGLKTPFLRPKKLSGDLIEDFDVIFHALKKSESIFKDIYDFVVLLRPTSPFREKLLIERGIKLLLKYKNSNSLRSVINVSEHPYRMWTRKNNFIIGFTRNINEPYNLPRQKLPAIYFQSGDIEIIKRSTLFKGSISGKNVVPLVINNKSIDIDSKKDLLNINNKWKNLFLVWLNLIALNTA